MAQFPSPAKAYLIASFASGSGLSKAKRAAAAASFLK
jgi:hypothetical protein